MSIRSFSFLTGLIILTIVACLPEEFATVVPGNETGTLAGSVKIGPLCPVEPCSTPVGDTYSSRQLQIRSEPTSDIVVSLNPDGSFETGLPICRYEVDLTDCEFRGCAIFLAVDIDT